MTIRTPLLATLFLLGACDFASKDIGDPSGETMESSSEASTTGAVTTTQGGSDTSNGGDTSNSSSTGVDPSGEPSTTTTGGNPSTTGGDSTSNGTITTTSGGGDATGTTGTESATSTSTTGEDATGTGTTGEPGEVMCVGDPPIFPSFAKTCEVDIDCAIALHTINCCGSDNAIGVNKAEVDAFQAAEAVCDEQYPACGCPTLPPVAEDGDSALDPQELAVECDAGQCKTFVP